MSYGPTLSFKYDKRAMARVEQLLRGIKNGMPKVMSRAINSTATTARSRIVKRLSRETKLKQSAVKRAMRLYKATYKKWHAAIVVTGKPIPAIALKSKFNSTGASYMHGDERKTVLHAFKQKMPNSKKPLMMIRAEKGGQMVGRYPIKQVFGPSLPDVFDGTAQVASNETRSLQVDLQKNIDKQIMLITNKFRGRKAA